MAVQVKQKKSLNKGKMNTSLLDNPHPESGAFYRFYLLIFLISFLYYGNTIGNGYSMDDELVTEGQANVSKGFSGIPAILTSRYSVNESQNYEYRPVVLISFAIEHQFFGENPAVSHFINIVLYALIGVVLFRLLFLMFQHQHWLLPAIVTIVFLIHPIHTEVVASLKNRDELLSFLFSLLSLRQFILFARNQGIKQVIFAVLFLSMALLSKVSAMTMIATIPVAVYYFTDIKWQRITAVFLFAVLAFALFKLTGKLLLDPQIKSARGSMYFENPMYDVKYGIVDRIAFGFHTVGFYIRKLLIPYPLIVYYGYNTVPLGSWTDPYTLVSVFIILVLLINTLRRIGQKSIFDFGVLWFFITVSMFANVVVPAVGIVAERFAFYPSLGFAVVAGVLIVKYLLKDHPGKKSVTTKPFIAFSVILVLLSSFTTISRNAEWSSRFSIYTADIKKVPESAKINALLAAHYTNELEQVRSGKTQVRPEKFEQLKDSARYFFSRALEIYPEYTTMQNNLGMIYFSYYNQPDIAFGYFEKAVELDSNYAQALFNLGTAYERRAGKYVVLVEYLKFADKQDSAAITAIPDTLLGEQSLLNIATATAEMENHIDNYIRGLFFSKSEQRLQTFESETPGVIQNGIGFYYKDCKIKPDTDSLTAELNRLLRMYINKEIFGDPFQLKRQALQIVFAKKLDEFARRTSGLSSAAVVVWAEKRLDQNILLTADAYYRAVLSWGHAIKRDYKFLTAYDRLNKFYQQHSMGDSLISLNKQNMDNEFFQKELLCIEIGNGYLMKNDAPQAIEWYLKSIEINQQLLMRLKLVFDQLNATGGLAAGTVGNWYKEKFKQIGETYYKVAIKMNEMDEGEKAQVYFNEAQKYTVH